MNLPEEKEKMRIEMREKIAGMPAGKRRAEEQSLLDNLCSLPEWKDSGDLLIFLSMPEEIQTFRIIFRAVRLAKKIWAPRMDRDRIEFRRVIIPETDIAAPGNPEDFYRKLGLELHPYGIWEPSLESGLYRRGKLDRALVLSPGLAFDGNGNRLGHGRGYYDRWFREHIDEIRAGHIRTAGIGYSLQLVEQVPHTENDIPLHLVLAGKGLISAG